MPIQSPRAEFLDRFPALCFTSGTACFHCFASIHPPVSLSPFPPPLPQVLHDAFFKYQTRPKLTPVGDIYYEGKEYEARVENLKPGVCSDKLREALGINSESTPPPWLINMQRYGPPPSYPDLKVPGLNAPIPKGERQRVGCRIPLGIMGRD